MVHAPSVTMPSDDSSRDVAEQTRETVWSGDSFLRDLFMGNYRPELLDDAAFEPPRRPEFWAFYERLESLLVEKVDPVAIDQTGEYPREVIDGLAAIGAFGMKIPERYGGLGLSHAEYVRAMMLVGSYDANVTALLSAHQAIGVPQPLMLFGTEAQREKYLPRCASGAISAFALTEPAVGSDPARLATEARKSSDGSHFVLDGVKLWCTNGTLAELIVVMARDPDTDRINAFVLEMDRPGVKVTHRCHFMGLRALANACIELDGVRVPADDLIGDEGEGLKIALVTLNTGRLSLPAATAGTAKSCTEIVRKWSAAREQWGQPIGKHEAVAHMNAAVAARAFAMESLAQVVGDLADREDRDIRLEAAAAKEWNTVEGWELLDDSLQVRGGRGYETEVSLQARGEPPGGIDRLLRDSRINRIFEGSSEIMHLFMAREAVDKHLDVAGALIEPKSSVGERLAALPAIVFFYARWYVGLWVGWGRWPRWSELDGLGRHLRFAERSCRKLARTLFHGMVVYRAGLEHKQAFLFRAVDIAMELFVLTAVVKRAHALRRARSDQAEAAVVLADLVARRARRRVEHMFRQAWRNDDAAHYRVGRALLTGDLAWLEEGIIGAPFDEEDLVPESAAPESGEHRRREVSSDVDLDAREAG